MDREETAPTTESLSTEPKSTYVPAIDELKTQSCYYYELKSHLLYSRVVELSMDNLLSRLRKGNFANLWTRTGGVRSDEAIILVTGSQLASRANSDVTSVLKIRLSFWFFHLP